MDNLVKLIQEIIKREVSQEHLFDATVTKVDRTSKTCTVETEEEEIYSVRLAAIEGKSSMVLYPKVGSSVVCGALEGNTRNACILKYSDLEEVELSVDKVVVGSGESSMVKGEELSKQLDTLSKQVQSIIQAINTAAVAPSDGGATFKTNMIAQLSKEQPDFTQIENKKLRHG
ncbi:hypothetical protein [Algivirga pacifica]|uniref:Uncharacterized protein n=1 Tax=Algivirga pacifica TaxID=1162670 RepID=A0ABP9D3E3_9BACT